MVETGRCNRKVLKVRVSTIYTLPMPFLTVRIPGGQEDKMEVDSVEEADSGNTHWLVAKKNGKPVGQWNMYQIVSWTLKDKADDPALK